MAWGNDQIRDLVIRTLLGESNHTPEGMTSVAHVMKTRADSGAWGDRTINGLTRVITAPKQFSMWNTDDPKLERLAAWARSVPTTDPLYQRAAAVADGVFGETIPDNTNGATNYHTPDVHPDWSEGKTPVATIGGHYFYKLPLTASNTAGTAVTSPSSVGIGSGAVTPPAPTTPQPVMASVGPSIQSFTGGDYGRQATADAKPFQGIVVHVTGKPDLQSELKYSSTPDAGRGNAYYGYHYIVDRDGKVYQTAPDNVRTNHIQGNAQHGLSNENAIGVAFVGGAPAGQNPLPMTPEQKTAGIALVNQLKAKYNIDPTKIVGHGELDPSRIKGLNADGGAEGKEFIDAYRASATGAPAVTAPPGQGGIGSEGHIPLGTASLGPPAVSTIVSPQVQQTGQEQQGRPQSPPAGFTGPGSDKVSLVQGMTTGTSHNPQLTTAWNLFGGGGAPAAPPAAAPAAASPPAAQPASAPAAPIAPTAPTVPPLVSAAPPDAKPGTPLTSIAPAFGQTTADYDTKPGWAPNPDRLDVGGWAGTKGQPTLGFPAMTSPFGQPPPDQVSQLPGSMLASAQNLIKLLFPSNIG